MNPQKEATPRSFLMLRRWLRRLKDLVVTLVLWGYFTAGFVLLFAPFYLVALLFSRQRPAAFQRLNHLFYKSFFILCRWIMPRHKWHIQPSVKNLRGAIIICNHVSYLDSILLVSLYAKHTTIAKDRLFGIPIFGTVLKLSGYIPSSGGGRWADLLLNSLEAVSSHLQEGGNVIVFPEGTRSRTGRIGRLHKGIFKIARYCRAPINVLRIAHTEKLFAPDRFLFDTCIDNTISLKMIAELTPDYEGEAFKLEELINEVHALLDEDS